MSAGGSDGTADRIADPAAEDERPGSTPPAAELPRKRKGDVEERTAAHAQQSVDFQTDKDLDRSEDEDQQVKIKCFREPHRQIEKRRRDKMNNLIDELAAMIPACQPMARKLDKLTVLRKAVQHLKALKAGTGSAFTDTAYKPSILPHDDLRHLLLRAADGFLLIVSCDRAKVLFISESVSKILNFSRLELTGQSLFDFIHPKDINKVKEQLSSSEYPRQRLIDAATGAAVQVEAPARPPHLATGARRSFFCRMKHSRVAGKQEDKNLLPCTSKRKDTSKYCTLHCTGYMRSWQSSQSDSEADGDKDASSLTCLVTVCRLLNPASHPPSKDPVPVKPVQFVTRCAIDGKFTFVEQQMQLAGITPTFCYFGDFIPTNTSHHGHRVPASGGFGDVVLRVFPPGRLVAPGRETQASAAEQRQSGDSELQVQDQVRLVRDAAESVVQFHQPLDQRGGVHRVLQPGPTYVYVFTDDSKQLPIIPGLSSGVGTMIYAGSIGTQIANELIDFNRVNSSPSSGASSPFAQEKIPLILAPASMSSSSREEAAGSSSQSQSDSCKAAGASSSATSESSGEPSQLDLDSMVVPGLSSFSSDEAAMAVIMSLLETDVNMSQSGDFEELHWPF